MNSVRCKLEGELSHLTNENSDLRSQLEKLKEASERQRSNAVWYDRRPSVSESKEQTSDWQKELEAVQERCVLFKRPYL